MSVKTITRKITHFSISSKVIFIILGTIIVLGAVGFFAWQYFDNKNLEKIAYEEKMKTITSTFYSEYGADVKPLETVNPKEYFVTIWEDAKGNTNISANFGGKWVLLSTIPTKTTEGTEGK
jgi:predicted negative regulator of RcsB-dependent stress response